MPDIFRKALKERMSEAEGEEPQDPKKGINKGDLPGPGTMTQADFLYGKKKDDAPAKKKDKS